MTKTVSLDHIVDNPFNARTTFDPETIKSLAHEMKAGGVWGVTLQGRRTTNGTIELAFGHRRLRALRLLNVPAITIEIVDLTDAQMSLRALEENLQRQGLTDLEKADAVKRTVELIKVERQAAGKPSHGAIQEVADRLGLTHQWISKLCEISASLLAKNRAPVNAGHLAAQTALEAKAFGGDDYVSTLAKQGQRAEQDDALPKPTIHTVRAMRKVIASVPEPLQEKLKQEIVSGAIVTPKHAIERARRMATAHMIRTKEPPPDLRIVVVGWTHRLEEWEQLMREVQPYMAYVDEVPGIANRFRTALEQMRTTIGHLLESERKASA